MSDAYSEAERASLEILRRKLQENKVRAYEQLRLLVIGDLQLKYSGYESVESATKQIIGSASKDNDSLIKSHERKYPDNKKEG